MVTILINNQKGEAEKKPPLFISLRFILLTTYLMVGMLPVLFVTNNMMHSMEEYFVNERKAELLSYANMVAGQVSSYNYLESYANNEEMESIILELSQKENFRILILDASSLIIYDTSYENQGQTLLIKEITDALSGKDVVNQKEIDVIYTAASVFGDSELPTGVVFISDDITDITNTVSNIGQKGNSLLITVILLVILTTFFLTKIFTEPLKKMIEVIQKMSKGHFHQRVSIKMPVHNEIIDLAMACNHMVEQLEKVDSNRQQFVSDVSHELKTPLSSVKVLSESILLQECTSSETYREFLGDINSEVDRMTAIINDLLTLVKLDQKELPLQFASTDVHIVIKNIIKQLKPLAHEKHIDLKYSNEKPVFAEIDNAKFSLAISNIIDNSIKYTPIDGEVSIKLGFDHQHIFVTISDTGIGIPTDEINHIFDRFYRVDKTRDRETGGTGLGLSITHSTILMHNGNIRVNSKEQKGTSMIVTIPLKQI